MLQDSSYGDNCQSSDPELEMCMPQTEEKDYVLGTTDEEIDRLALQHRVWRPRTLDAWQRASFTFGQTILDVGCGPGHATLDLAGLVGANGKVIALERSRRFLDYLAKTSRERGISNIETHELDLEETWPGDLLADRAWCRWIFCFLREPRATLAKLAAAIRPGGTLVMHEYFDYGTWRMSPRLPELEEFVALVMKSWRDEGGEPDIGLDLPQWLAELDFEIKSVRPLVDVVPPSNFIWNWPRTFIDAGVDRLVSLGHLTPERSSEVSNAIRRVETEPNTHMVTPAVVEIIAVRK